MNRHDNRRMIVIDTLGKLADHGYGVGGYCLACRSLFDVSLPALILERGRDYSSIRMAALPCPICQGRSTQYTITAPPMGG